MDIQDTFSSQHQLLKASVISFGNFDGVHLGHQALFETVLSRSKQKKIPSCLLTFQNHPLEILRPEFTLSKLTDSKRKMQLIEKYQFDLLIAPYFSKEIAEMSPNDFLERIFNLVAPKHFIVGQDVGYGKSKSGDLEHLQSFAQQRGATVEVIAPKEIDNVRVSSTCIREYIAQGNCRDAARMLGRPYAITGYPKAGLGVAKTMGFPTVNLDLHNLAIPREGVYAGAVKIEGEAKLHKACIYIGKAKTLHPRKEAILEAYVLDSASLKPGNIEVCLISFLRPDMIFDSVDDLVKQIQQDILQTRNIII